MLVAQKHPFIASSASREHFYSFLQIIGASLFIAFCAQLSLPLYFTPVPLSAQTFAIMLVAATMGSRKGVLSVLTYLLEGSFGLPVFAGGSSGLLALIGIKGGYIIGFVLQAYLVGKFIEKQKEFQSTKTLTALLLSCLAQLGLGVLWLSLFVGFKQAFILGFCPFILGEALKSLGLTAYLKAYHPR